MTKDFTDPVFEIPKDVPSSDYLVALGPEDDGSKVYQPGGSWHDPEHPESPGAMIGNPDGLTFTEGDARRWWQIVFDNGVNYSKVRPVFLPGSHVLTEEGIKAAERTWRAKNAWEAPNDWNPLGLEVIA